MDPDPIIVASLREFYSREEIRSFWQDALAALIDRRTTTIHINRIDRDGQSDSGIVLAKPEECQKFIAECKEAIRQIDNEDSEDADEVDPSSLGRGTDRSFRMIRS